MVASYTQLLERRYRDKLDGEAREFMAYAVDGALRMQTLINDLLAYSRVGTHGKPLAPLDANSMLQRALTNLKVAAAFPTDHRLHAAPPAVRLNPQAQKLVAEADVILSLDWLDLGGTLRQAFDSRPPEARVIQVSCDAHSHRGWSMDYQSLPPADVYLLCEPDSAVPALLEAVKARAAGVPAGAAPGKPPAAADTVTLRAVAEALGHATAGLDVCITRLPLGWHGAYAHFRHPLDYIGYDGGGGLGSGPGITVGAALALKGSGRLPLALCGDGDFLMGSTAVWTAAHYRIPCLMIVCNNRSFFNDEMHQERVALARGRPVENRWIGQRIADPEVDIAAIARAQGAVGIGPVARSSEVQPAIERAAKQLGVDRVDMMLLNAPPDRATFGPQSARVTSAFVKEAIQLGRERFRWDEKKALSGRVNGSKVTGVGVALSPYVAGSRGMDGMLVIRPDGRLTIHRSTDAGMTFDPIGFTFLRSGWGTIDADPSSPYVYAFVNDEFYTGDRPVSGDLVTTARRPLIFTSVPVSGPFMKQTILSGESGSTNGPLSKTYLTPTPRPPMYFRFHSSGIVSKATWPAVRSIQAIRSAYPPSDIIASFGFLNSIFC